MRRRSDPWRQPWAFARVLSAWLGLVQPCGPFGALDERVDGLRAIEHDDGPSSGAVPTDHAVGLEAGEIAADDRL